MSPATRKKAHLFLSNKIFELERALLDKCVAICKKKTDNISLCFDGLLVPRAIYSPALLKKFNTAGKEFGVSFKVKDMDQALEIDAEESFPYKHYNDIEDMIHDDTLTKFDILRWAYETFVIINSGGSTTFFVRRHSERGFEWVEYKQAPGNYGINYLFNINGKDVNLFPLLRQFTEKMQLRTYQKKDFVPYFITEPNGLIDKWTFNTFTPFVKYESEEPADFTKSQMFAHLRDYLCAGNEEIFNYLLDYIACSLQKPYKKVPVALILWGAQGTGKDTFANFLTTLFGEKYFNPIEKDTLLENNFNAEYSNKLFHIGNEMSEKFTSGGEAKHNHIKGLITQRNLRLEKKGIDAEKVKNFGRWIFLTNNAHSFFIEDCDRRMVMFAVKNFLKTWTKKQKAEYFNRLYENELGDEEREPNADFYAGAWDFFANRDITSFNYSDFPETEFKLKEKFLSLSLALKFVIDILAGMEIVVRTFKRKDGSFAYHKMDLYKRFVEWCEENGTHAMKKDSFFGVLEKYGLAEIRTKSARCIHFPLNLIDEIKAIIGFDPLQFCGIEVDEDFEEEED
jgi:hypothetical protein